MLKLLLAIKKRGVDIDRIYNHDVDDDGSSGSDMENCVPDSAKVINVNYK